MKNKPLRGGGKARLGAYGAGPPHGAVKPVREPIPEMAACSDGKLRHRPAGGIAAEDEPPIGEEARKPGDGEPGDQSGGERIGRVMRMEDDPRGGDRQGEEVERYPPAR